MTIQSQYNFNAELQKSNLNVTPDSIETLWVNITRVCNQACTHCHVGASPERDELMERDIMDACLEVLANNGEIETLDITGGAPELHPDFPYFVKKARDLNKHVIVRSNLTVMVDDCTREGWIEDDLPGFFADNNVEIIASLPYYSEKLTDRNRGKGVFRKSIDAIRRLNEAGYGKGGSGLVLNLMHNASGPISPDERTKLEEEYRQELKSVYGLFFTRLYAVTNAPINRFRDQLIASGGYNDYLDALVAAFNSASIPELVCRNLISIGYDGRLYDCDFNQMLELQVYGDTPLTIFDFDYQRLLHRRIRFATHCFGCTAGGASS